MARRTLTREALVAAGFELLAEGGLGAITARALAAKLSVQPGALYYHVKDMNALTDEMATAIVRELVNFDSSEQTRQWQDLFRGSARHMRRKLLNYRDGAKLFAGSHLNDDDAIGAIETPLAALTAGGFALREALWAWQSFYNYVIGYVIEEQERFGFDSVPDERYQTDTRQGRIDDERYPLTYAAAVYFTADADEQFEFGVETMILGLQAQLAGTTQGRTTE